MMDSGDSDDENCNLGLEVGQSLASTWSWSVRTWILRLQP